MTGPWLITGAAGFIGSHVAARALADGVEVVGVDNLSSYYDPALKQARLDRLAGATGWRPVVLDLAADPEGFAALCAEVRPEVVVHLAAQPGVRHALDHPRSYVQDNVVGFLTVLEACRHAEVGHLVYASSSSVYGETSRLPFSTHDPADHPVSLYAATKRAGELLAHSYSHLFGLPCTGLRFFTVYGPWGRPDMAYYAFAEAILDGRPITVYGDGSALRDMTYIDDVVEGVVRVAVRPPVGDGGWAADRPDPAASPAPWRLFNIGHGGRITVNRLIEVLERELGTRAIRVDGPPIPGDVTATRAEVGALAEAIGFTPSWEVEAGLARFVAWLRDHREGR